MRDNKMLEIVTGQEFYQMLTKHIELPQIVDNIKITLTTEEFSKIIVNDEEIDIDREKAIAIYQEMEETYKLPAFVQKLEISYTPDSAVVLKFESVLISLDSKEQSTVENKCKNCNSWVNGDKVIKYSKSFLGFTIDRVDAVMVIKFLGFELFCKVGSSFMFFDSSLFSGRWER